MCADMFTKAFNNPFSWSAACELVGISREGAVCDMIARGGRPLPPPDGSGKRGRWEFRPDGSGRWFRVDACATSYRPVLRAGPLQSEVTSRTTIDMTTGEQVGPIMRDYATAKFHCEPLPEPTPRAIRTIFTFDYTSVDVPPECRNVWPPDSAGEASIDKSSVCAVASDRCHGALASGLMSPRSPTIAHSCQRHRARGPLRHRVLSRHRAVLQSSGST